MCGRFSLTAPGQLWFEIFGLSDPPAWAPRYNIAPTQPAPTVVRPPNQAHSQFRLLQWGSTLKPKLPPPSPPSGQPSVSAGVSLLADGFYEWQGQARSRQPFYIRMSRTRGRPLAPVPPDLLWCTGREPGSSL